MPEETPPYTIDAGHPAPPRDARPLTPLSPPSPSNSSEGVATTVTPTPMGTGALITGRAATVVTAVASVAGFVAGFTPWPFNLALAVLALVAAGLCNALMQVPKFLVGHPLVSAQATPALILAGGWLGSQALTMPDGWLKGLVTAASVLCFGLAGAPVAPGGVQVQR